MDQQTEIPSNTQDVRNTPDTHDTPVSQLPMRLATFTAAWSSADYVTTALCQVDAEGWRSSENVQKPSFALEPMNKDLRIIMDLYGDTSTL
jgi:hypothetical protein